MKMTGVLIVPFGGRGEGGLSNHLFGGTVGPSEYNSL